MERKQEMLEELKKTAEHRYARQMRKRLRVGAIGSIIFGVLAIVMGINSIEKNPLNIVPVVLGGLLVIEGILLIVMPTPIGMMVDGSMLFLLGAWNIFTTVYNIFYAHSGGHEGMYLGIFQIGWGIQAVIRYRRLKSASLQAPNEEAVKKLDEVMNAIMNTKTADTPDLIEFQTNGVSRIHSWKAKLVGDVGIFVMDIGSEVFFVKRDDIQIENKGKVLIGKTLKIGVRLEGRKFGSGTMAPEWMERYERWKAAPVSSANP